MNCRNARELVHAYADDELVNSLRAMQATVAAPQILALSTPNGRRGYFFEQFTSNDKSWKRILVKSSECPRISPEWLAEQLREMGPSRYAAEFECAFLDNDEAAFSTAIIDAAFTSEFKALWT